jgi:hypothetical protein
MSHHAFPKLNAIVKVTLDNPLPLHLDSQWLEDPYHKLQRPDSIMMLQDSESHRDDDDDDDDEMIDGDD